MKLPTASLLLALIAMLIISGCSTIPGGKPTATAQTISAIVQPVVTGAVPLVLNKNPGYAPVLLVIGDSIPAAFSTGTLTPESIAGSLALLTVKAKLSLDADAQALIATALSICVQQYQLQYGVQVANATDPNVVLILNSFAQGLRDGVTIWQKSHATTGTIIRPVLGGTTYFTADGSPIIINY